MGADLRRVALTAVCPVALALAALGGSSLPASGQPAAAPTASPSASPSPAPAAGAVSPAGTASPAGNANPAANGTPATNAKEQQLLERIRQLKAPRWRSYGVCRYDWSTWRLTDGGVRTTDAECGTDNARAVVAVHCDTLQVSRREGEGAWSPWRLPLSAAESKTTGGEDLMVAALCANIKPASEGAAAPAPLKTVPGPTSPAAKPASAKPAAAKPATAKPAAKPASTKPATSKPATKSTTAR